MTHALLSPSSADRWLNCPPSVRLGEHVPQTTSDAAAEGTLAHAVAELYARLRFKQMSKRTFNTQIRALRADPRYSKEMDGHAESYTDTLAEHAMQFKAEPHTALEVSIPIGSVTGEPGAHGTADCIQIGEGVLWISDYKYGANVPVNAFKNPQMMIYALGALALYASVYGDSIKTVHMTIIQPRLTGVSDWEISRAELEAWGRETVAPSAARALAGQGEQRVGDWCRFCPIRGTCRARADDAISIEEAFGGQLPPLLTDIEVGEALTRGESLLAWYNDVKKYAETACKQGKDIPGWKLVEKKGQRKWINQDDAFKTLKERGIDESILWKYEPITPPALEKKLDKEVFAEAAAGLIQHKASSLTLVPESDKRPKYTPITVEEAFERSLTQ